MGGITGLETLRRIRQMDSKLLVILMTAYGTTQTAIEAMKLGAYDYLLKPFDVPKLKEIVANALKAAQRHAAGRFLSAAARNRRITNWASSAAASRCSRFSSSSASSPARDATALITGESGTGKELVARAIYHHSNRSAAALSGRQLRRHSRAAARKRIVRPRTRRVHRRDASSASASSSNAIAARFSWMKSAT